MEMNPPATPLIQPSERLNGIGEYYFSRKLRELDQLRQQGRDIINLGIGSPDLPPHPDVIRVLQEAAARPDTHAYQSYKGAQALRQAMADWYAAQYGVSLDPDHEILPLMGSKEGILHCCMAFLSPGDEALVPDPGYPTYSSAVHLAGARVRSYPLREENNYYPDWEALEGEDLRQVKIMWVSYPHMPTGQPASPAEFERIRAFAERHRILVVHDNPYSFILHDRPLSLLQPGTPSPWVLELNSLSKSHNMAGWRVGMLLGHASLIQEVLRFKSNMDSGMYLPLQLAAARALALGPDWFDTLNAVYRSRREEVFRMLDIIGARYRPGQAGLFVWATVPDANEDGYALSDRVLAKTGVFLTPGGIFGEAGRHFIRISLCTPAPRLQEAADRMRQL
jgi:aspartate/methionine/tyrosine aminotransferase